MRKLALIAVAIAALLLAGCSSISEGYITAKKHSDAYTYYSMQCISYSAKGQCTGWMTMPHHVPEQWVFDIEDGDDTGWVSVDSETWADYQEGDFYPRGER